MKLLLILLAVSRVGTQNTALCPFECICERTTVVCKGLDRFPRGIPNDIEEILFDVSNFGSDFKQNALQNFIRLKKITFMNSKFEVIHPCVISDLTNITKLEFSKVEIGEFVMNGFSHLSYIKEISIVNSTIRKLHSYAFNDISFVDNFTISNVVIDQLEDFVFNNFSSMRFMQLKHVQTSSLTQLPFLNFQSIDHFEVKGSTFPSSLCGMEEILKNESVKKIKFQHNKLKCSCNVTWIFETRRDLRDFQVGNNTCLSPTEFKGKDIIMTDKSRICRADEVPTCGDGKRQKRVPTCKMFTLDEPIMPGETVHYPVTESSGNKANFIQKGPKTLFILLIVPGILIFCCH